MTITNVENTVVFFKLLLEEIPVRKHLLWEDIPVRKHFYIKCYQLMSPQNLTTCWTMKITNITLKTNDIYWKDNSFKSVEVCILGYGCGASVYPHSYDQIDRIFKIIPCPFIGCFVGTKEDEILK